jgi:hypothetical protein
VIEGVDERVVLSSAQPGWTAQVDESVVYPTGLIDDVFLHVSLLTRDPTFEVQVALTSRNRSMSALQARRLIAHCLHLSVTISRRSTESFRHGAYGLARSPCRCQAHLPLIPCDTATAASHKMTGFLSYAETRRSLWPQPHSMCSRFRRAVIQPPSYNGPSRPAKHLTLSSRCNTLKDTSSSPEHIHSSGPKQTAWMPATGASSAPMTRCTWMYCPIRQPSTNRSGSEHFG